MPKKLFLIDAHAHIYQAYYAIKGLTGPDGEAVNAVYGFARLLKKLRNDYSPDYMAVAFDTPGKVFRHDMFQDYKATRKPMPEDLRRQIPVIRQMLGYAGTPALSAERYEADDVIGAAARLAAGQDVQSVLVTTDKDAEQLIDDMTSVLHIHRHKVALLDAEGLKEAKGIEPWQVVELMALAGDSSDNVPGAPKVGPKTAADLIDQFGSVMELYENLDKVKSQKLRERLAENREQVELSRRLVQIDTTVPIHLDLEACRTNMIDVAALNEFYRALGFSSLIDSARPAPAPAPPARKARQGSLFADEPDKPDGPPSASGRTIADVDVDYETLRTPEEVRALAAELPDHTPFSVDTETTSLDPHQARIVGISFSWREFQGVYIACDGPEGEQVCPVDAALDALRPVLQDPKIGKIGQNLKYDIQVLRKHGIVLEGAECDTMIADYLLHPNEHGHGLNALASRHLDYQPIKTEEVIGEGKTQLTMAQAPVAQVARYACEDADVAFRLYRKLMPEVDRQELLDLLRDVEMPLVAVLADMEFTGVRIDGERLRAISEEFQDRLEAIRKRVLDEAGLDFNLNSPKQLSQVLFEHLKLPIPRGKERTTGYATDSDVLADLAGRHAIAKHLLQWRELSKLKGTYADALAKLVNPVTGRLHTSLNQTGTATGRLSSSEPNLQNIPVRTPLGRRIRSAFVPGAVDMSLLSADYSQVELRVLAHCSADEALRDAFRRDRDIHRFVASQIADVPEADVTADMRQRAKAVNFGIVYGLSAYGLARQIGVPVAEAQQFIDAYFARYPKVKAFIGHTIACAHRDGCVHTLAGRRRLIHGINATGPVRSAAERIAVNTVIQGTAADLVKIAMISIARGLASVSRRSRMLLQIHDELLFEAPDEELDPVGRFVVDRMSNAMELAVPLKVDTAVGKTWEEAK